MALDTSPTASRAETDDFSHKRRRKRRAAGWLAVVGIAVVVAVVLRLFVVQTFFVPSGSMEPTLQPGDRMIVLKLGYTIQRGAVLVFRHPPAETPGMCADSSDDDLVKRVIGLPGEVISSVGNTVYINHKALREPWLPPHQLLGPPIRTERIPAGEYFMMGDNRTDSCDSRRWGPIPGSLVIGRVVMVLWRNGHPDLDVI